MATVVTVEEGSEFANGTEYMIFSEAFCCRCKHYKLDDAGFAAFVEDGGCPILDKIERAAIGEPFPVDDVVSIYHDGKPLYWHICKGFECDDELVMLAYKRLFEE